MKAAEILLNLAIDTKNPTLIAEALKAMFMVIMQEKEVKDEKLFIR